MKSLKRPLSPPLFFIKGFVRVIVYSLFYTKFKTGALKSGKTSEISFYFLKMKVKEEFMEHVATGIGLHGWARAGEGKSRL